MNRKCQKLSFQLWSIPPSPILVSFFVFYNQSFFLSFLSIQHMCDVCLLYYRTYLQKLCFHPSCDVIVNIFNTSAKYFFSERFDFPRFQRKFDAMLVILLDPLPAAAIAAMATFTSSHQGWQTPIPLRPFLLPFQSSGTPVEAGFRVAWSPKPFFSF